MLAWIISWLTQRQIRLNKTKISHDLSTIKNDYLSALPVLVNDNWIQLWYKPEATISCFPELFLNQSIITILSILLSLKHCLNASLSFLFSKCKTALFFQNTAQSCLDFCNSLLICLQVSWPLSNHFIYSVYRNSYTKFKSYLC